MRIEFSKNITCRDYVEAAKINGRRTFTAIYCYFAVISFGAYYFGMDSQAVSGVVILIIAALWFEGVIPFVLLPRKYRKTDMDREKYAVVIDDEGISAFGPTMQARTAWEACRKYVDSRNLILLYDAMGHCVITPKRCLLPSQLEDFETFLRERFRK